MFFKEFVVDPDKFTRIHRVDFDSDLILVLLMLCILLVLAVGYDDLFLSIVYSFLCVLILVMACYSVYVLFLFFWLGELLFLLLLFLSIVYECFAYFIRFRQMAINGLQSVAIFSPQIFSKCCKYQHGCYPKCWTYLLSRSWF